MTYTANSNPNENDHGWYRWRYRWRSSRKRRKDCAIVASDADELCEAAGNGHGKETGRRDEGVPGPAARDPAIGTGRLFIPPMPNPSTPRPGSRADLPAQHP